MAEAMGLIGLVASIGQLIDLGCKVTMGLKRMARDHHQLAALATQVPLLLDTVDRIKKQADGGAISEETARKLTPVIESCLAQLARLGHLLEELGANNQSLSRWDRTKRLFRHPMPMDQVDQITKVIHSQVHALLLHQTTSNLDAANHSASSAHQPRPPVFLVPFRRERLFVGREDILLQMEKVMMNESCPMALWGIGGVGKSQIAIQCCYIYQAHKPSGHVFWVHGSSAMRFEQSYRDIAKTLKLPGLENPATDVCQLVFDWLDDTANGPWLMVLDNADDERLIFRGAAPPNQPSTPGIIKYVPTGSRGCLIITTRDRRVGERVAGQSHCFHVLPFPVGDALKLLQNKIPKSFQSTEQGMMDLIRSLHGIPLMITQAAAYIQEEGVDVEHYLGLLQDEKYMKAVLEEDYYDPSRDHETRNSTVVTWQISFELILRNQPNAARLLSLMVMYDRHGIPRDLLETFLEDKVLFDRAAGVLKSFAFIDHDRSKDAYSFHQLVQLSTRMWLQRKDQFDSYYSDAFEMISSICPKSCDYEKWKSWERVYPHIQSMLACEITSSGPASIPVRLRKARISVLSAGYDISQGRLEPAYRRSVEAVDTYRTIVGNEDPETLAGLHTLGSVIGAQGKYREADQIFEETVQLRRKVLGPDHPDTLASTNNQACIWKLQGQYEPSLRVQEDTLRRREQVLGERHPDTLTTADNLAMLFFSLGLYDRAEQLHRRTYELRREVLGPTNPSTLTSGSHLASILSVLKRYDEAENLHRWALAQKTEILGIAHPSTLASMNDLAVLLNRLGDRNDAEQLIRLKLKISTQVLGSEHPDTLASVNNLSLILKAQGRNDEAEPMLRDLLVRRERVLGAEHPNTLATVDNLALVLQSQGKYREAVSFFEREVQQYEKQLGPKHPLALAASRNLRSALQSLDNPVDVDLGLPTA